MSKSIPKPWPRLSETLTKTRAPDVCQRCDCCPDAPICWQECDEQDDPEQIYVVLCQTCADIVIEKHPRLYHQLDPWAPRPGAMPLCVDCTFRDGVRCTHADLKANGGAGLGLRYPLPTVGFWDGRTGPKGGRRAGGMFTRYHGPVSKCAGRQTKEAPAS